jgi:hypothetical protein
MGPVFVDCTPAFFRVEEPAGGLEYLVLAMAHHPPLAVLRWLGETSLGYVLVYLEATSKPADVCTRDGDLVVRAAVAGAVGAVVENGELGTQVGSPSGCDSRATRRMHEDGPGRLRLIPVTSSGKRRLAQLFRNELVDHARFEGGR